MLLHPQTHNDEMLRLQPAFLVFPLIKKVRLLDGGYRTALEVRGRVQPKITWRSLESAQLWAEEIRISKATCWLDVACCSHSPNLM